MWFGPGVTNMAKVTSFHLLLVGLILAGCSGSSSRSSGGSTISKTVDKQLLEKASTGDSEAQYQVSKQYYDTGKAEDYRRSIEFLTKSAEQGHAQAQCRLARMYLMGHGGSINYAEAAKWLTKAAEQNLPEAQYDLGIYYICGRRFFPKNGDIVEILTLVLKHSSGRELFNEHDVELGLSWLEKAKEHGYSKGGDLEPLLSMLRFMDFKTGRIDTRALLREKLPQMLNDKELEALLK